MSDYPEVQRLLGRMLRLEQSDLTLPLDLLVRMYTDELRRPLHNMAELAKLDPEYTPALRNTDVADAVGRVMDRHYPSLVDGELYYESPMYVDRHLKSGNARQVVRRLAEAAVRPDRVAHNIISDVEDDWQGYEPVVLLYYLTLDPDHVKHWFGLLETALCLDESVERMLLDLS